MDFDELRHSLDGEFYNDKMMQSLYATDASVYRELPLAVTYPSSKEDIRKLILFARKNKTTLIPRTAGTSLAGQCVGNGIVVDVSKYFNKTIEIDRQNKTVTLEPGVIRDVLNLELKKHQLFFGPETSTANRAMIGGMVGNNSSGSNSIKYGVTRDHVLEVEAFLSDGSLVVFKELDKESLVEKLNLKGLEGEIYRHIYKTLSDEKVRKEITERFPKASIHRRNTGYAIDVLMKSEVFNDLEAYKNKKFNFCKLIAGSEGTLALITKIKLQCTDIPPEHSVLICPHYNSINDALESVQNILRIKPFACELMDKTILDCTKDSLEYTNYRFFLDKDPKAVLIIELKSIDPIDLEKQKEELLAILQMEDLSYSNPIVLPPKTKNVWKLRKAGLGLLANLPGTKKAVAVIEDTAVALEDLSEYIKEFTELMSRFHQNSVYYAHAGAGEIHLRPILDLKKGEDVRLFKEIAFEVAKLVKKYNGSLSGEHGDGRLRASFLEFMVGEKNYQILKDLKSVWDVDNVFNAGKIIKAKPIDADLRYVKDREEPKFNTVLDFSETGSILNLVEKCNGSGDCRKLAVSGGTMCPSYMATKKEKDTTRARANILREFLTNSRQKNKFNHPEIKEVLDLCLSCKGCKSECPSNVDMAAIKAEFLYQYQLENGVSFRTKLFAETQKNNKLASKFPSLVNFIFNAPVLSSITKRVMGVAQERTLPRFSKQTLKQWFKENRQELKVEKPIKTVHLFADEFTNYNDVEIGIKAIKLLSRLRYQVDISEISDSGRTYISKGVLKKAKELANWNIEKLFDEVNQNGVFVGIEPSAILSFRDEYKRLINKKNSTKLEELNRNIFLIDEFLSMEIEKQNILKQSFCTEKKEILFHGHCHQKALSKIEDTQHILSFPENYSVKTIPSGCCGMAGSFGYEKENYKTSMQIGELVLFPAVRKADKTDTIVATGTSCRHQISDGTQRSSKHSVEVLFEALTK